MFIHGAIVASAFIHIAPPINIEKNTVEIEMLTVEKKAPPPKLIKVAEAQQVVMQDSKASSSDTPVTRYLASVNQKVEEETKAKSTGAPSPDKDDPSQLKDLSSDFAITPDQAAKRDDYFKDVKEGSKTLVNTREFVYYGYYTKMKEAIRTHWESNVRERVKFTQRHGDEPFLDKNKVTQLLITLSDAGILLRVEILRPSGVADFDVAALNAIRAATFPEPPPGLADASGAIKIRWDFVLEK